MRLYLLSLLLLTVLGLRAQDLAATNATVKLEAMDKVRFRVEEDPSTGSRILAATATVWP